MFICMDCGKKLGGNSLISHECISLSKKDKNILELYIFLKYRKGQKVSVSEVIKKFEELFPEVK